MFPYFTQKKNKNIMIQKIFAGERRLYSEDGTVEQEDPSPFLNEDGSFVDQLQEGEDVFFYIEKANVNINAIVAARFPFKSEEINRYRFTLLQACAGTIYDQPLNKVLDLREVGHEGKFANDLHMRSPVIIIVLLSIDEIVIFTTTK